MLHKRVKIQKKIYCGVFKSHCSCPPTCRTLYPRSPSGGRLMYDKESLLLQWEARLLYGIQSHQESSAQCREAVRSWACPTPTWSTSRLMLPLTWVLFNNSCCIRDKSVILIRGEFTVNCDWNVLYDASSRDWFILQFGNSGGPLINLVSHLL